MTYDMPVQYAGETTPQQQYESYQTTSKPTTPSSIPKNITNITGKLANMKTLQLMTKMQQEHEEKQKRRKLRRQQMESKLAANGMSQSTSELKQQQQSTNPMTPKTERKFLSSIMNTLFSSGGKEAVLNSPSNNDDAVENGHGGGMTKNEAKRLSLKRLKAKDKAKKKGKNMSFCFVLNRE